MIVELIPPEGQNYEKSQFDPFPGSDKALDQGCTCPLHQPWPKLHIDADCTVHMPERVAS